MKVPLTPEEFVRIARAMPRDERTPYAFEKRIMAHLSNAPVVDTLEFWARALWRATAPCLAVMIIAMAVYWPGVLLQANADNDSVDLESAVLAPTQLAFDLSR